MKRLMYVKTPFLAVTAIAALAIAIGCATSNSVADHHEHKSHDDIVDTAISNGNFTTLVAAVKAAGLVDTLKSPGPLTVFAPTDDAFAKLPKGTVESLLKPENKDKLVSILTYHVAPGKLTADKVLKRNHIKTAQGQSLTVMLKGGKPYVDNAQITATDIKASNGVIHVIDTVVMPK